MSFLFPLGLLGLIGIPILILIYIIKSKYTEQTVSSTYLWTLSEKFLKRKRRSSPLAGIISLILQILAVTVISLAIARPIITVPNSANEYCFILDGSGSMRMETTYEEDTLSRFDAAKRSIRDTVESAIDGSIFTLVYAGDTTGVICERVEDKEQILLLLDELTPVYNTVDLTDAIGIAQGYFNENPGLVTYLVTDENYTVAENMEIRNIATAAVNYSLSELSHTHLGRDLVVNGIVTSFEADATLTLSLYLDGAETPDTTLELTVKADEPTPFSISTVADAYANARIVIEETDAQPLDNEFIIYNVSSENSYNTLLVSDRPFFLQSVLRSQLDATITVVKPEDYRGETGYGLYVFDTIDPTNLTLPRDGAVWMINVDGSVEGAGYTVQGAVTLPKGELMSHATTSSSATQALTEGMRGENIYMTRYIKSGFYRNFTTLLSYKGNPLVFAGTNEYGNRQVVMAFDLHDTNLPLLYDYTAMMRNLISFSFPNMVDETDFTCGESATVNVIANCESIRVVSPSGEISYLKTDGASDSIQLAEVGTYTVNMTVSGSPREFYLWSAMNPTESDPTVTHDEIALRGTATAGGFDGKFDPLTILFIVLAVIFLADWMVYCYEKYQLR